MHDLLTVLQSESGDSGKSLVSSTFNSLLLDSETVWSMWTGNDMSFSLALAVFCGNVPEYVMFPLDFK
jgi:hypothetical protein